MAASKVVKKYRRSSKLHVRVSCTDESLLNYDTFEVNSIDCPANSQFKC